MCQTWLVFEHRTTSGELVALIGVASLVMHATCKEQQHMLPLCIVVANDNNQRRVDLSPSQEHDKVVNYNYVLLTMES